MTKPKSGSGSLPCVEVRLAAADLPRLEEVLAALGLPCASWTDVEAQQALAWVFAASPAEAQRLCLRLNASLQACAGGWQEAPPHATATARRQEDWATSWKRHFHTIRASRRLVLKPSWEAYTAGPAEIVLEFDPGMCFGTGQHGTTRACLSFLDDLAARLGPASLLDAGCGSGILTLGGARLGYWPIAAFDHDPEAVRMTQENLAKADIRGVEVVCADLADYVPARPCRVVVANVLASVLEVHRRRLCTWLERSAGPAYLILSGIETGQYAHLRAAFTEMGLRELTTQTLEEWTSGCFES